MPLNDLKQVAKAIIAVIQQADGEEVRAPLVIAEIETWGRSCLQLARLD